jgi:hypothetical protein
LTSMWSFKCLVRPTLSWFVACGLISALLLFPTSASPASDPSDSPAVDLSGFEGHWRRIEASESDLAREDAIETAVQRLSWIMRRMASGILRKSTAPPAELQFAWDGERLYQGVADENGGFARLVELDGELITLKDGRGVDFASAWAWTGEGLRVRWEQHQANGNNVYRLDEDAQSMIVEHTINVTAISNVEPIIYLSRFNRTDLPARSAVGLGHVDRMTSD